MRAFIAVRIPENILSSIRNVQEDLKKCRFPARWVRPENIHLTLKFFGNIDETDMESVVAAMKEYAGGALPMKLSAKGIGVFPSISRPRVIWVGLSGQASALLSFQAGLEKTLEKSGFKKEERSFKGHLTIGRFKDKVSGEKLIEAIGKHKDFIAGDFEAGEMILYKSDLLPGGPVYTELFKAALTAS